MSGKHVFMFVDFHNIGPSAGTRLRQTIPREDIHDALERYRKVALAEGDVPLMMLFADTKMFPPLAVEAFRLGFVTVQCPSFNNVSQIGSKETVDQVLAHMVRAFIAGMEPSIIILGTEDRDFVLLIRAMQGFHHEVVVMNDHKECLVSMTADRHAWINPPAAPKEEPASADSPLAVAVMSSNDSTAAAPPSSMPSIVSREEQVVLLVKANRDDLKNCFTFPNDRSGQRQPSLRELVWAASLILSWENHGAMGPREIQDAVEAFQSGFSDTMKTQAHRAPALIRAAVDNTLLIQEGRLYRLDPTHQIATLFLPAKNADGKRQAIA